MFRLQNGFMLLLFFAISSEAQIVSMTPPQNALQVSPTTNITATFSQDMNAATINDTTFLVWGMQSGPHKGTITYNAAQRQTTFAPLQPFAPGETVMAALTGEIRTAEAKPLAQFQWQFTIGAKPSSGRFAAKVDYSTGNEPVTVVAADLDGDQDMDLAVTNYSARTISILKNLGNGKFAPKSSINVGAPLWALAAADLDGDKDIDLAATNFTGNKVFIFQNNGQAIFQQTQSFVAGQDARVVIAADLDSDGDLDLAVATSVGNTVAILKNNGNATFQPKQDYPAGSWPYAMAAADLDKDGDVDLAVANYSNHTISILKNNSEGVFQPKKDFAFVGFPLSLAAADLDNDGDIDLAATGQNRSSLHVILNNGNGDFSAPLLYPGVSASRGICAADLDGDGDSDVAAANANLNVSILKNNDKAVFLPGQSYAIGNDPLSLAAADLDGDGDLDLATANHMSHNISILINRGFVLANVSALDFSKVYLGQTKTLRCKIFNYGPVSINMAQSVTNNKFNISSPPISTLAPGDSAELAVEYAPTAAMNDTGTVIISPSGLAPERIALKGSGTPPNATISAAPAALDFGNVTINTTADLILNLTNSGVLDLHVTNIVHANARFAIHGGVAHTLRPGETKLLAVSFTAPFLGSQLDTLKIFSNDAQNNPLKIPISSSVVATPLPEIAVKTLELAFDSVVVNASKRLSLRVYNRGAAKMTVHSGFASDSQFVLTSFPVLLRPGDSSDYTVRFQPRRLGLQLGLIYIFSADPNEKVFSIQAAGIGKAAPAPMLASISPTSGQLLQSLTVGFNGENFIEGVTSVNLGPNIVLNDFKIHRADSLTATILIAPNAAVGPRNFTVSNSGPGGGVSASRIFMVNYPPPTLARLSPTSGVRGQTLNVEFAGNNFFNNVSAVNVGPGLAVNRLVYNGPSSLVVTLAIPLEAAPGQRQFSVTNAAPGGGASTSLPFLVQNPVPVLSRIWPFSGTRLQVLDIGFKGANFISGLSNVNVGPDINVNKITVHRSDSLTARITILANAAIGVRTFTVSHAGPGGGTSETRSFVVGYPTPVLTRIRPESGARLQTLEVGFTGANFYQGATIINAGLDILFNSITVHRPDSMTAKITIGPNATTGPRNFTVANGEGISASRVFFINNPAPTLASLAPAFAFRGRQLTVAFTGTNFIHQVTQINTGAGITVNSVSVASPTSLVASLTIMPATERGDRSFAVANPAPGGGVSRTQIFSIANFEPAKPKLLSPVNHQLVELSRQAPPIKFVWGKSFDADPEDTLKYALHLSGQELDTTFAAVRDTSVLLNIMPRLKVNSEYSWNLRVSDGLMTATWPERATFRTSSTITSVQEDNNLIPGEFHLEQNYPNPFALAAKYAETTIKYQLPKESLVTLKVFDMLGREMIALVHAQQAPGYYNVIWNGRNANGQLVPGGIYLCRLQAGSYERVMKMMLVR